MLLDPPPCPVSKVSGYLVSQPLKLKILVTLCLTGQREALTFLDFRGSRIHSNIRHIWRHSKKMSP